MATKEERRELKALVVPERHTHFGVRRISTSASVWRCRPLIGLAVGHLVGVGCGVWGVGRCSCMHALARDQRVELGLPPHSTNRGRCIEELA
eukprot:COSAG01_NODE_275_length_19669_cov_8.676188_23_plen_92_part_00